MEHAANDWMASTRRSGSGGAGGRGRVLLAHRFYYPDVTTYSQMLRIIGEHLDQDEFDSGNLPTIERTSDRPLLDAVILLRSRLLGTRTASQPGD